MHKFSTIFFDSPCTSETLDSAFLLTSINDSILLRWAEAAVSSIELVCADVMVGFTTATNIIEKLFFSKIRLYSVAPNLDLYWWGTQ